LNFMPCVLPVLSLKIFSFLKDDGIDKKIGSSAFLMGIDSKWRKV
jgi:thiol:disulfide interchange protein